MYMYMYTTKTDLTFFFCSFNNNWSLNFVQKEKGFTPPPPPSSERPLNPQVLWAVLIPIKFHVKAILSESLNTYKGNNYIENISSQ